MTLAPLAAAPAIIWAHAGMALAALGLGIAQLAMRKGDRRHRMAGWIWVALMAGIAGSSFWISGERFRFGPFSGIHLVSAWTLVALPLAVWAARRHRVRAHAIAMISLFTGALVIAGLFTLAPGRILGRSLFG